MPEYVIDPELQREIPPPHERSPIMSEYTTGVITGVIISAIATLALAPVTGHIHANVAESRMEKVMEEALGSMPSMPSMDPEEFQRDLQENIDRYMPR